jgi:hypothetical protein
MEQGLQSSSTTRERLVLRMNAKHSPTFTADVPGYAELQHEIHHALLAQHPEWILPSGESPTCDSDDARFAEVLRQLTEPATRKLRRLSTQQPQFQFQHV